MSLLRLRKCPARDAVRVCALGGAISLLLCATRVSAQEATEPAAEPGPPAAELGPPADPPGLIVSPPGPPFSVYDDPILVTVEGDKAPAGASSLGRKVIREMPGVLGDPYRAIEVEPGVTPVASGVPFYFIRGAPPGNIGYFYDGIAVPMLFHVGAGPGVIPPSMVSRVELHMGPYPANFGRLAGAIVDADAAPAQKEFRAEGVFRTVDLGGLVEGPLPDDRGSLLLGGHYSVGAEILSAAVPSIDLRYGDYQGRMTLKVDDTSQFSLLTFGSYDYLATLSDDVRDVLLDSDFHRVDMRFTKELAGGGSARVGATLGLDQSRGLGVEQARDYKLASRATLSKPLSDKLLLRGGFDLSLDGYDVTPGGTQECTTFVCSGGLLGADTESQLGEAFEVLFPSRFDLAMGAWIDTLIVLGDRATLTPGLRFDYFHSDGNSDFAIDPKLTGRFGVTDAFRLVPSVGLASQLPGFPPLPGLQIGGIPGGLQRSLQTSFGAEGETGPIDVRGSVFRQATFNLTDAIGKNRGGGFGAERFLDRSTGDSYGLEVSARGALSRSIFFLASYTLSRTTRSDEGRVVPSAYDRTHVAQVAFLYDLGKNWKAGLRSLLYSGFPAEEVSAGDLASNPDRVKPFFRLDARLSKRWIFGERAYVGLVFDMQNVTLAKEVFDVTCEEGKCTPREIGPITIPTLVFEAGY